MIRPKQHPLAPSCSIELAFRIRRRGAGVCVCIRSGDDVADEAEFFGAVGDGVEVEAAEVVARVVVEVGGGDGVVGDAGGEAGGELGEGAAGVGEEEAEGRVTVEYAGEYEACCCL